MKFSSFRLVYSLVPDRFELNQLNSNALSAAKRSENIFIVIRVSWFRTVLHMFQLHIPRTEILCMWMN